MALALEGFFVEAKKEANAAGRVLNPNGPTGPQPTEGQISFSNASMDRSTTEEFTITSLDSMLSRLQVAV